MRKGVQRIISLAVCGMCFQFVGCQSNEVVEVFGEGVKGIAADVSAIFWDAVIDQVLGLV